MGRPSVQLDRELLRALRNKKELTQADLARELCERLGLDQDEDTRTASYRRIEARGSTSRKRAEAIAEILGVTTEYLEGIVPPDTRSYEKRIRDLLAEQLRQENSRRWRAMWPGALRPRNSHGTLTSLPSYHNSPD